MWTNHLICRGFGSKQIYIDPSQYSLNQSLIVLNWLIDYSLPVYQWLKAQAIDMFQFNPLLCIGGT